MIKEFQKEYRWLSNFTAVIILVHGKKYPSVEAAYMSGKSDDIKWKDFCADLKNTPGEIKRKSKTIKLISTWDEVKVPLMRHCLEQKFQKEPFRSKLITTGDQFIQEGNNWGDKFWGVDLKTGVGENILGKLIMEIRSQLNAKS